MLTVIFNEEERAIVKKSDLRTAYLRIDHVVGPKGPFELPLKIKNFRLTQCSVCSTSRKKAKLREQELL